MHARGTITIHSFTPAQQPAPAQPNHTSVSAYARQNSKITKQSVTHRHQPPSHPDPSLTFQSSVSRLSLTCHPLPSKGNCTASCISFPYRIDHEPHSVPAVYPEIAALLPTSQRYSYSSGQTISYTRDTVAVPGVATSSCPNEGISVIFGVPQGPPVTLERNCPRLNANPQS